MTGWSLIGVQWIPSGDFKAWSPSGTLGLCPFRGFEPTAQALYFASGVASGLASLKGTKLVIGKLLSSLFRIMLFFLEPSYSTNPNSGLIQWMPSLLWA